MQAKIKKWGNMKLPEQFGEWYDQTAMLNINKSSHLARVWVRHISSGTMGRVELEQYEDGTRCAVKYANEFYSDELQKEIQTLLALDNHPYIVNMITCASDYSNIVLEYVDGMNLYDFACQNQKDFKLSPTDFRTMLFGVASGLEYLHQQLFIHRDIKPQNILLDMQNRPKICDFGVTTRADKDGFASDKKLMGTLDYIAPEALEYPHVYHYQSDIYALGITMLVVITGKSAYSPEFSQPAQLRKQRTERKIEATIPDNLNPQVKSLLGGCITFFAKDRPCATNLKLSSKELAFGSFYTTSKSSAVI